MGELCRDLTRLIVVKDHFFDVDDCPNRVVLLLIRNPYDALMAEYNRRSGGHIGYTAETSFLSSGNEGLFNMITKCAVNNAALNDT